MDKRIIIPGLAILIFSVVWFGADASWTQGEEEEWVALVGDSPLHLSDYRDAYRDYILSTGLPDTPRRRTDFLERLVTMRLLALDARKQELADSPEFDLQRERIRQKLLIEGYVTSEVLSPIEVTEDELREMFVRVNTRWEASHLYAANLEEAAELKARLDAGEAFADLAREVFADEQLRANGGSVGEFGFDEMDWAFEDAVFAMNPGDISDPVQTAQGYSIIRLDNRFTQPILTESEFAERKGGLTRYVLVRKHEKARDVLRESILDALAPRFDDTALEALLSGLNGTAALDAESELLPSDVLVEFNGGQMTAEAFLSAAGMTSEEQRAAVTDTESLRSFIQGLLIRQELVRRAEEEGIEETQAYHIADRREQYDLQYEAAWKHLEGEIVVPDDSIAAHMARFPAEFEIPARVRVQEVLLDDASLAAELARQATSSNFAELAAAHSIRQGAAASGGDLGFVTREQLGQVALPVFDAPVGSIVGPLAVGGRFVLFHVVDKSPERPATIAESRERIEDQLRAAWVRKTVRERAEELRSEYPIERRLDLLDDLALRSTDTPSVATLNP